MIRWLALSLSDVYFGVPIYSIYTPEVLVLGLTYDPQVGFYLHTYCTYDPNVIF